MATVKEMAAGACRDMAFQEGKWLVKTLREEGERMAAYRLRHTVYSQALKWVPEAIDQLEIDAYDPIATSLGLFGDDGTLAGMIRLVPSPGPFMLEEEFKACLAPAYRIRREPDTNEITRLTVDPSVTEKGLSSRMLLVLLKGLYQWLILNEIRYSYMVVEKRFLRVLNILGFPARAISPALALPPANAVSVAALLDWEEFRSLNGRVRPAFLQWMSTVAVPACGGQTVPGATQAKPAEVPGMHLVAV